MNDKQNEKLETVKRALRYWDPIGVIDLTDDDEMLFNEYDTYAAPLLLRLEGGDTVDEICYHLAIIRVKYMGLGSLIVNDCEMLISDQLVSWRESKFREQPVFN